MPGTRNAHGLGPGGPDHNQTAKGGKTMIRKLTFKPKLLLAFSVTSLFLLAVGGLNYWALTRLVEKYSHVADINWGNTETLSNMRAAMFDLRIQTLKLSLAGGAGQDLKGVYDLIDADLQTYHEQQAIYLSIPF